MNRPFIQLVIIQFKEYIREPGVIFWSLLFPVLMAWGLGLAFGTKNESIHRLALISTSEAPNKSLDSLLLGSNRSGQIIEKAWDIEQIGRQRFIFRKTTWAEALIMLKRGEISMIVEEKSDTLLYHFDSNNAEAKLAYLYLSGLVNDKDFSDSKGSVKALTVVGTRYIDFLIPGLIAMGVMTSVMWGISYTLIERRNKKLMRRMIATPMRKSHFLLSLFVARVVMSLIELIILVGFASFYFHIKIEGSLIALSLIMLSGIFAFWGIAILVSSRTANTYVGNGLINVVVLPMMILSGVYFSYHNFPDWSIGFIQKLPLTVLADGIRAIFIEGAGLRETLVSILVLTGIGGLTFGIGLKIYRWF
jgi:ABC-2 type transport system permease protein